MTFKSPRLVVLVFCLAVCTHTIHASNVCYLTQSGCKYRVTVLPSGTCQEPNDDSSDVTAPHNSVLEPDYKALPDGGEEGVTSLQKLAALEQKLVRMIEELSVRSLRHIREIRSDLRHVITSINQIKGKSGKTSGVGSSSLASPSVTHCPAEFVGVGTWPSCYRFSNFEATWPEAKEYCSAFGANLLTLDSIKEAFIIDYLIKSNTEYQEPKGWWSSGNYVVRSNRWMWAVDQQQMKSMELSRWAPGEPNARSTMHCMILYKPAKYYWHDATCSDKHTFICELQM